MSAEKRFIGTLQAYSQLLLCLTPQGIHPLSVATKAYRLPSAAMTELPSLADPSLLIKIDKLFACGVGDYVALPQLVVVGDQSSGKSSVLEGLTKIPFPRDSTLCTRFATQITFRRSPETKATYSIVPTVDCTDVSELERLKGWRKTDAEAMTAVTFAERMKEVFKFLQVGDEKSGFSKHVFRIEISGPE